MNNVIYVNVHRPDYRTPLTKNAFDEVCKTNSETLSERSSGITYDCRRTLKHIFTQWTSVVFTGAISSRSLQKKSADGKHGCVLKDICSGATSPPDSRLRNIGLLV